ncbi:MAG: hypothetical protein RBR82_16270 [Pseudomonas sp.]|nr:hypothetical protein [Pseudomonas sp.]
MQPQENPMGKRLEQLCRMIQTDTQALDLLDALLEHATQHCTQAIHASYSSKPGANSSTTQHDLHQSLQRYNRHVENTTPAAILPQALTPDYSGNSADPDDVSDWAAEVVFALYHGRQR